MVTYIVREGDSIFSIAENFGVSESQLTSYNGLANQPGLVPGQAIIILSPDITATVQPETVFIRFHLHTEHIIIKIL